MENLAHTLAGALMCRAGLEKKTPLAMPAMLVAANLPDVDVLGIFFGRHYLDVHRGTTHAAAGVALLSVGMAGIFWGASRLCGRARSSQAKFAPMWLVCFLGLISHPALDYLNDYGLRPWLPFGHQRYYGDLLSIVDPWMWVLFGSALGLLTQTHWGRIRWGAMGFLLGCLIFSFAGLGFALRWATVLVAIIGLFTCLLKRGFHPAPLALSFFAVYLAGTAAARGSVLISAQTVGPDLVPQPIEQIDVIPGRPGNSQRWQVVMESADKYYVANVGLQNWRRHPPRFESFDKNLDDPRYRESLGQNQMAAMARFARFPYAQIVTSGDYCTVFLRDLRYARQNQSGWGVARATIGGNVTPAK